MNIRPRPEVKHLAWKTASLGIHGPAQNKVHCPRMHSKHGRGSSESTIYSYMYILASLKINHVVQLRILVSRAQSVVPLWTHSPVIYPVTVLERIDLGHIIALRRHCEA